MKAIILLFLFGTFTLSTIAKTKVVNQKAGANQEQTQKKKTIIEFSNVKEKKDEYSNTIFSFRITNNGDKKIVAIKFQYVSTKYDIGSILRQVHTENKKISLSPQHYMEYTFKINYDKNNEGFGYQLFVTEVIYEDGSFDKGHLQIYE